ncbi:hypothetical protein J5N97_016875 [Dioscorea zingiberensis]|uniref:Glycolipid transfer protein domain-containing protein n=1 Tax=Dioscorea zingiberensis TaxID=325984 RepID=A0A9D5HFU2_9LILI|nr:hypothetical protein J5N97_016875 [Dioscorea zingiberensis]
MAEEEEEREDPWSSSDEFKEVPDSGTALAALAEGFEELARKLEGGAGDLRLDAFTEACSLVSVLFGCLGIAFKFAEFEYVSKVNDLYEASKTYDTLKNVLDYDIGQDTVKKPGSRSRHLRRVRLGLDLVKALFEQFLSSDDNSLREAASNAYAQTCAPYHPWAVRKAVGAGMYALPTREQLILNLNETDDSIQKEMTRYIIASRSAIIACGRKSWLSCCSAISPWEWRLTSFKFSPVLIAPSINTTMDYGPKLLEFPNAKKGPEVITLLASLGVDMDEIPIWLQQSHYKVFALAEYQQRSED